MTFKMDAVGKLREHGAWVYGQMDWNVLRLTGLLDGMNGIKRFMNNK